MYRLGAVGSSSWLSLGAFRLVGDARVSLCPVGGLRCWRGGVSVRVVLLSTSFDRRRLFRMVGCGGGDGDEDGGEEGGRISASVAFIILGPCGGALSVLFAFDALTAAWRTVFWLMCAGVLPAFFGVTGCWLVTGWLGCRGCSGAGVCSVPSLWGGCAVCGTGSASPSRAVSFSASGCSGLDGVASSVCGAFTGEVGRDVALA